MWDYIYYSLYLDKIDTSDHNAIENISRERYIQNEPYMSIGERLSVLQNAYLVYTQLLRSYIIENKTRG